MVERLASTDDAEAGSQTSPFSTEMVAIARFRTTERKSNIRGFNSDNTEYDLEKGECRYAEGGSSAGTGDSSVSDVVTEGDTDCEVNEVSENKASTLPPTTTLERTEDEEINPLVLDAENKAVKFCASSGKEQASTEAVQMDGSAASGNIGDNGDNLKVGDRMRINEFNALVAEKHSPRQFFRGDVQTRAINQEKDGKCKEVERLVVFNVQNKGWNYSWHGTKHTSKMVHCLSVYLFRMKSVEASALKKENAPNQDVLDETVSKFPTSGMELECVAVLDSPAFTVYSRKKKRRRAHQHREVSHHQLQRLQQLQQLQQLQRVHAQARSLQQLQQNPLASLGFNYGTTLEQLQASIHKRQRLVEMPSVSHLTSLSTPPSSLAHSMMGSVQPMHFSAMKTVSPVNLNQISVPENKIELLMKGVRGQQGLEARPHQQMNGKPQLSNARAPNVTSLSSVTLAGLPNMANLGSFQYLQLPQLNFNILNKENNLAQASTGAMAPSMQSAELAAAKAQFLSPGTRHPLASIAALASNNQYPVNQFSQQEIASLSAAGRAGIPGYPRMKAPASMLGHRAISTLGSKSSNFILDYLNNLGSSTFQKQP